MWTCRSLTASVIDDAHGALRHLVRTPARSGVVVVILAMGIGLSTALFAAVHSLRSRPATGIPSNDGLVRVRGSASDLEDRRHFHRLLPLAEVRALTERSEVFDAVTAWTTQDATVAPETDDARTLATVAFVMRGYFEVLGVSPILGRSLGPDDAIARSATPAVIAYELWTGLFGRDRSVLGHILRIDDAAVTIVGVTPPGFHGPNERDRSRVVWLPLWARARMGAAARAPVEAADSALFSVVARLADHATSASASAVVDAVAARTARPRLDGRFNASSAEVVPLLAYNDQPLEGVNMALAAVTALSVLVLLIVATNVAVLLAGAAVAARREIAVRLSLGAGRARIARQLLIESVLLATAGGGLGVSLILAITAVVDTRQVQELLIVDWPALLVTVSVTVIAGVVSGILPALHATRVSLSESLKSSATASRARSRLVLQRRLVALQIAVTQPLLLGIAAITTLLADGARASGQSPIGGQVLVVDVDRIRASVDASQISADAARFVGQVRDLAEVTAVVSQQGGFSPAHYAVRQEDRPAGAGAYSLRARNLTAAPGFFGLMDMPIMRGREFEAGETDAVIIGSDLARTIWGSADPIGRRLHALRSAYQDSEVRIVGVVDEDVARRGAWGPGWPVWVPPPPGDDPIGIFHAFYVRTRGPAMPLIPAVTRMLRAEVPELTIRGIATLEDKESASRSVLLAVAGVATGGGVLALLLASIGLYASATLAVRQRTREVGIRVALGARSASVQWLFLVSGLQVSAIGVCLGLPLSALALQWLAGALELPSLFLGSLVAGSVLAVTSLATWMPARRAASLDPSVTLRAD